MSIEAETRPARGILLFVLGGVLFLVGITGVVLYATAFPDASDLGGGDLGILRAATVIGAAIATGAGVLLVVLGIVKRRAWARSGGASGDGDQSP